MLNMSTITLAVETLLNRELNGYLIERNPLTPPESGKAARAKAWVGIYRGQIGYLPKRIGGPNLDAELEIVLEIQAISLKNPAEAENKLSLAEQEILTVLQRSRDLEGQVGFIRGFRVEYGLSKTGAIYFQTAIITVTANAQVH